ncbi:MAG: hypothetical protein ACWA5L_03805, partial [bacterium]
MTTSPTVWLTSQQVNDEDVGTSNNDQDRADVVGLSNGGFVVAYTSNANGDNDVRMQLYDALGNAVGSGFEGSWFADSEFDPQLAAYDGGFVVVFEDLNSGSGTYDIRYYRYDNDGTTVVSAGTVRSDPGGAITLRDPRVDANSDGSFLVTYEYDDGNDESIRATAVDASDTVGTEFTVRADDSPTGATSNPTNPDMAILSNGNFVTVLEELDGSDADLEYSIRTQTGSVVSNINITSNTVDDADPRVTALEGGGFAITWVEDTTHLMIAVYENDGSVRKSATQIFGTNTYQDTSVAALKDGGFAIWFEDETTDKGWITRFDSSGTKVGFAVEVSNTANDHYEVDNIALLDDGRLA